MRNIGSAEFVHAVTRNRSAVLTVAPTASQAFWDVVRHARPGVRGGYVRSPGVPRSRNCVPSTSSGDPASKRECVTPAIGDDARLASQYRTGTGVHAGRPDDGGTLAAAVQSRQSADGRRPCAAVRIHAKAGARHDGAGLWFSVQAAPYRGVPCRLGSSRRRTPRPASASRSWRSKGLRRATHCPAS